MFVWNVTCLYGMLRVCMDCYVFVWIVTCLYGMLRVCMECYVFVWNVTCLCDCSNTCNASKISYVMNEKRNSTTLTMLHFIFMLCL